MRLQMKQHEREYFISRVRSGVYKLNFGDLKLTVVSPTIEQEYELNIIHNELYKKSESEGILTQEQMLESMKQRGLWTDEDEEREKGLEKDIERLQVECFHARNNEGMKRQIKFGLEQGKKQHTEHIEKKFENYGNTCEGIASTEKVLALIKMCTFTSDGKLFDFESITPQDVTFAFGQQFLSEGQLRELARNDPWRTLWSLYNSSTGIITVLANKDRCLNTDQRNLFVWSRMYDSVQESMDCPNQDVITDDDMLDGWFLIQKNKQDKQRAESELENSTTNPKIANSDEIMLMAHSQKDADRINDANSMSAQRTKRQRMKVLQQQGEAVDLDFQDQKMKLHNQSNEQYKGKFRR